MHGSYTVGCLYFNLNLQSSLLADDDDDECGDGDNDPCSTGNFEDCGGFGTIKVPLLHGSFSFSKIFCVVSFFSLKVSNVLCKV